MLNVSVNNTDFSVKEKPGAESLNVGDQILPKQEEKMEGSSETGGLIAVVLLVSVFQTEVCVLDWKSAGRHSSRAPLTETHGSNGEAKLVCEVFSSHYGHVPQRKQLDVLKLKHRLPSSRGCLLSRLIQDTQKLVPHN